MRGDRPHIRNTTGSPEGAASLHLRQEALGGGFGIPTATLNNVGDIPDITPQGTTLAGEGTKGTANAKFVPLDPNALERMAVSFDRKAYGLSDADWQARFPELAAGREYAVGSALGGVTGQPDPFISGAMNKAGFGNLSVSGDPYQQARSLGIPILAKENRDRNYFATLLRDNPLRSFGLNGNDIANIAVANTGARNALSNANFSSRLNAYQSNINQQIQNQSALIGGIGKITGAAITGASDAYLNPTGYGNVYGGGYTPAASVAPSGGGGDFASGDFSDMVF